MNCKFLHIATHARLNNLLSDNVMGLKILKWKCACGKFCQDYLEAAFLKMSNTLRVRSSGSTFCRNYQRTKRCRSGEELVVVIVYTFNTVYCFQFALHH